MSRITVNGRAALARPRQLDERGVARELIHQRLGESDVAVAGDHDSLPEDLLDLHPRAVVDEIAVPDEHDGVLARRSFSWAVSGFASGAFAAFFSPLSSSLADLGERRLELAVSRTARGYSVPEGLNARIAASPCVVAANESRAGKARALHEDRFAQPLDRLAGKCPGKSISNDPSRAVAMSCGSNALSLSESSVGSVRAPAPVT